MSTLTARLTQIAGSAMVLMFYSEFLFLNEGPATQLLTLRDAPLPALVSLLETVAWYMVFSWGFLILLARAKVADLAGLVLVGTLFGWATEALIVPIVHEAPPISWVFPSISWHALIDVVLGWYLLRRAMRRLRPVPLFALFVGLGVVWALWARWLEDGALGLLPVGDFILLAVASSVVLLVGLSLSDRAARHAFTPSRVEIWGVALIWVALFTVVATPFLPWSLGLIPCVGLTLWALARPGPPGGAALTDHLSAPPPFWAYACVPALPLAAGLTYAALHQMGVSIPTEEVTAALLLAGAGVFFWALWRRFTSC